MEVEAAVGIRPPRRSRRVDGCSSGDRVAPAAGTSAAGLRPVAPAVVQASLGVAGTRGLRAPMRRWRPAAGGMDLRWRPGAGAVVTCEGPCGISAQAVVALRGLGSVAALAPHPAVHWCCGHGGPGPRGALRSGWCSARPRRSGWGAKPDASPRRLDPKMDAVVLSGSGALDLTRAGSPGQAAPVAAAQIASGALVAALFETCLVAGGLGGAAGSQWSLAVTP